MDEYQYFPAEIEENSLKFIKDEIIRESINTDISGSLSALSNNEFKAATVLGGAALEALLLWAIEARPSADLEAARTAPKSKVPSKSPVEWHLADYILTARAMGLIEERTEKQASIAQDARNLIHPGREQRLRMKCDRGTAHAAMAAVQFVITDLEKYFPVTS